jgi:peptide/nickel transport system permease protein
MSDAAERTAGAASAAGQLEGAPLLGAPDPRSEAPEPAHRGYWAESWRRFKKRKLSMIALSFVGFLALVALFSPAIAGTKPIIAKYKGRIYFPALGYFNRSWENPIFRTDDIYPNYAGHVRGLAQEEPPATGEEREWIEWAVWPLVYQDAYRRVRPDEWPGQPGNPTGVEGRPNRWNIFGTDQQGFDVFAQMVHGTRIALTVGFVSMGIAAAVGITVGALAGYFGGWIDTLLSRLIELVLCVPPLVLILALLAVIEEVTNYHLMAVVGLTNWTSIARLARAEFLKLKQLEFVAAARALGAGHVRIMFRHMLRNALAPVLVPITFGIAAAILIESALSFLGFGAPPPNPSWGSVLRSGRDAIQQAWWLILFPGIAIFLTVLAYNLIGEGLQEATDPRLRQAGH